VGLFATLGNPWRGLLPPPRTPARSLETLGGCVRTTGVLETLVPKGTRDSILEPLIETLVVLGSLRIAIMKSPSVGQSVPWSR